VAREHRGERKGDTRTQSRGELGGLQSKKPQKATTRNLRMKPCKKQFGCHFVEDFYFYFSSNAQSSAQFCAPAMGMHNIRMPYHSLASCTVYAQNNNCFANSVLEVIKGMN
jgi:hypothetical protein